MRKFEIGDKVILKNVPDSLIHDLPPDEQNEMLSFVGKSTVITEIDENGYYWIGFGMQSDDGKFSNYHGHSFSVSADCLEAIQV